MFFEFLTSSKLEAYKFDEYSFKKKEAIAIVKPHILAIVTILLSESIKTKKSLRYQAGKLLTEWMQHNYSCSFGIGNSRKILGNNIDLAVIAMAAQIKYCLEAQVTSTYSEKAREAVWYRIATYVENPEHKVKLTKELQALIEAKTNNTLAEFLAMKQV